VRVKFSAELDIGYRTSLKHSEVKDDWVVSSEFGSIEKKAENLTY
jgi:hypothetical protein